MLTVKETELVIDKFFNECLRYWKMQLNDERKAYEYAIDDIERMKHDPYVPKGDLIDVPTKEAYVKYRKMDLGRY